MRAFVLAGGRSRRMGQDKALLRWQGRPLIEHALEKLRSVDPAPRILGSRDDLAAYAPVIADNYAGMGPLAGIEAALAVSDSEVNLFLAVDVPLVPVEFLRWLAERAERTGAGATLPRLGGRMHPLCAVYHRHLHPHLRDALAAGEAKVLRAIPQAVLAAGLRVDTFDMEALAAADTWSSAARRTPLHRWLENWNSPQDVDPAGCSGAVNRAR